MHKITQAAILAASFYCGGAWAYGGGGGSSSGCAEPKFFEPTSSGTVSSLAEFGFIASDNTDIDTLIVEINGQKIQPVINKRRSGDFEIKAVLPQPITQAGKARIAINAKSKEGCWGFQPYFLDVRP
jgi:hypothetical protein